MHTTEKSGWHYFAVCEKFNELRLPSGPSDAHKEKCVSVTTREHLPNSV